MISKRKFLEFLGTAIASTTVLGGYGVINSLKETEKKTSFLGSYSIFASQDLAAFKKVSKEEAKSIVASSNIKFYMKLDDPEGTYKLFRNII